MAEEVEQSGCGWEERRRLGVVYVDLLSSCRALSDLLDAFSYSVDSEFGVADREVVALCKALRGLSETLQDRIEDVWNTVEN